jgi:hypothetical protein
MLLQTMASASGVFVATAAAPVEATGVSTLGEDTGALPGATAAIAAAKAIATNSMSFSPRFASVMSAWISAVIGKS